MPREPRLRTVEKVRPPYPLGRFPDSFGLSVGQQIIYLLATKQVSSLEGPEWEAMFAEAIGAEWRPSNVGLDDIVLGNCTWGAKTIKANNPWAVQKIRLISGRNSPVFSYGSRIDPTAPPAPVGRDILDIWNTRVDAVRSKYKHVRTVVLIKSNDLLRLTVFEIETLRYDPELYEWTWNQRNNLEGRRNGEHRFTWQPHGSQFTIIEGVPELKLCLRLRQPQKVSPASVFRDVGYDDSWVEIVSSRDEIYDG